ncbi:MAG: hypothetical protein PUP93_29840 [Rhizonema sp. NSF051]|nr:hypothetical protein [Rhizonema sp. NSF051]
MRQISQSDLLPMGYAALNDVRSVLRRGVLTKEDVRSPECLCETFQKLL